MKKNPPWDVKAKRDVKKVHRLLKRLGEKRLIPLDEQLMVEAENKRYTWEDYSYAHWILQVIARYRGSAGDTQFSFANITAAACEKILKLAVRSGPKAAKKECEIIGPFFGVPSWIALPDDKSDYARWLAVRTEMQRRIRAQRDGD